MNRGTGLAAIVVCLLVGLPFLGKAYHIDDPFVLSVSRQILRQPLRPFNAEINWQRNPAPIIEITKNPPLVSYYLAPFIAAFGYSERALHGAMLLFPLLLGIACVMLGQRFGVGPWWPLLFVLFSPAIILSGNVMRDVPAAALGMLGMALFVQGTDRCSRRALAWGATLIGLATLAKYSSATLVAVLLLYVVLRGRWRLSVWLLIPAGMLGLWSLWNYLSLGRTHIGVLLAQRASGAAGFGRPMIEKLLCGLTVPSAMLYLLPPVVVAVLVRRRWAVAVSMVLLAIASFMGARAYQAQAPVIFRLHGVPAVRGTVLREDAEGVTVRTGKGVVDVAAAQIRERIPPHANWQYYFWMASGAVLLAALLVAGLVGRASPNFAEACPPGDGLFLAAWVAAVFAFGVILTPFQAVRHYLPALVPTAILALRFVGHRGALQRGVLIACLLLQAGVGYLVGAADAEHAASYARFVRHAQAKYAGEEVWFNGHWGFHFYAEAAGFKGMNRDVPPFPPKGAIIIAPSPIPLAGWPKGLKRELIEEFAYPARVPARAIDNRHAYFYALVMQRSPYFFPGLATGETGRPLITCSVYRVTQSPPAIVQQR